MKWKFWQRKTPDHLDAVMQVVWQVAHPVEPFCSWEVGEMSMQEGGAGERRVSLTLKHFPNRRIMGTGLKPERARQLAAALIQHADNIEPKKDPAP